MRLASVLGILSLAPLLGACAAPGTDEPPYDPDAVAAEIEARLRSEIARFEGKDCTVIAALYGDREPLFVVGGRTMARRADLEAACPGLVSRIPDGASRPVASEAIYALGPESGYSVTEFRVRMGPNGEPVPQFVTKIWQKSNTGWRIVHVHESVAPVAP